MTFTHLLLRRVLGGGHVKSGNILSAAATPLKSSFSSIHHASSSYTFTTAASLIAFTPAAAYYLNNQTTTQSDDEEEETEEKYTMRNLLALKNQVAYCDAMKVDKNEIPQTTRVVPNLRFKRGEEGSPKQVGEHIIRRRMTSIGRFSMKSETTSNPSIPTFFLALANNNNNSSSSNKSKNSSGGITASEFESLWIQRDMHNRHPRFHSRVSKEDDRFFEQPHHPPSSSAVETNDVEFAAKTMKTKQSKNTEEKEILEVKAEIHNHAIETSHPSRIYREELRKRIEDFLTKPLDIMDKLWEVEISTGPLGSSGAIGHAKVNQIRHPKKQHQQGDDDKEEPTESILLFRAHHALADGVSLAASFLDLTDEAEEMRQDIENEIQKRKKKRKEANKELTMLQRWLKLLRKIIWFYLGSIRAILYQVYITLATSTKIGGGGEPFEHVRKMYEEEEKKEGKKASSVIGKRSLSWCDAATLEEVKLIAKAIGKNITLNDVFVSCASSAIARQLAEHRQLFTTRTDGPLSHKHHPYVNVAIPVHLNGGFLLPGKSVGNNIGAMVARIPGEINNYDDNDTTDSSVDTAVQRLKTVHMSIQKIKNTPAPLISYVMAKFCSDFLPESVTKYIFQNANANAAFVLTNSRGSPKKLHIRGQPVESATAFFPLPPGVPVGIVVGSYAGVVSISVTAEKWAIPDADKFLGWILEEYGRLRDEAVMIERKGKGKEIFKSSE